MARAIDILTIAQQEIGVKERPSGSNNVKYNTAYYGSAVSGSAYPWCCAFVWWVFNQAGAASLFNGGAKTAYCPTAMAWYQSQGRFHTSDFKPGDVVFFTWSGSRSSPDHIGIVESVNADGTVNTIEGNTSVTSNDNGGAVMRRVRSTACIVGAGRPDYTAASGGASNSSTTVYMESAVQSVKGDGGSVRNIFSQSSDDAVCILIQRGDTIYYPVIVDTVKLTLERKGTPGKLEFTVVKDAVLNFHEGDAVKFVVGGITMFYGFVFRKKRDRGETIQVTAYDQLRYLKNKDTITEEGLKASDLLKRIAADFRLNLGVIDDTGYTLETIVEENQTLFDIIQNALDETLMNTKQLFVLFDEAGRLTLKNINSMKLGLLIDEQTGENFSYESSIDEQTYNKIKLAYNNEKTGKRELYIAQDGEKLNQWGVLQYFEQLQSETGAAAKADALLKLYDQKTRKLTVENAFGDVRVRAGSSLVVALNLGDIITKNLMVVDSVKHTFQGGNHFMELKLIGGEFIA